MMECVDATGRSVKVSKTTDIALIRGARTLRLLPKRYRSKGQELARADEDEDGSSRPRGVADAGLD